MTTVNKFYDEIEINELCFFPFALIIECAMIEYGFVIIKH